MLFDASEGVEPQERVQMLEVLVAHVDEKHPFAVRITALRGLGMVNGVDALGAIVDVAGAKGAKNLR